MPDPFSFFDQGNVRNGSFLAEERILCPLKEYGISGWAIEKYLCFISGLEMFTGVSEIVTAAPSAWIAPSMMLGLLDHQQQ